MSEKAIVGVKSIKMGATGANGTMGAVLTSVGLFVPDSVVISFDEINDNPIYIEDYDNVFINLPSSEGQPKSLTFSIRDVSPDTMARFMGGSVTGDVWTPPAQIAILEQSVEVLTRPLSGKQYKFEFNKCTVFASFDGQLKKSDTATLKVRCSINTPYDANNEPLPWGQVSRIAAA